MNAVKTPPIAIGPIFRSLRTAGASTLSAARSRNSTSPSTKANATTIWHTCEGASSEATATAARLSSRSVWMFRCTRSHLAEV